MDKTEKQVARIQMMNYCCCTVTTYKGTVACRESLTVGSIILMSEHKTSSAVTCTFKGEAAKVNADQVTLCIISKHLYPLRFRHSATKCTCSDRSSQL